MVIPVSQPAAFRIIVVVMVSLVDSSAIRHGRLG
jgi:hypothetical protein